VKWLVAAIAPAALAACSVGSDPATRLAADIEDGAGRLGSADGATLTVAHATPSKAGQCEGPYKVQLDRVGALIIWCYDSAGATVSSHSTSTHARSVDTRETFIVEKGVGETLSVQLERQRGHAVVVDVT
jgi:hypothetical protein